MSEFITTVTELTDERIENWLRELEERYGMTSAQFLLRYNRGELDDDPDFIDWSGLLYVAAKVKLRTDFSTKPHA
jgi:hypothetical protein